MDEFDASTAPTEGREATSGRGAQGYPVQPAAGPTSLPAPGGVPDAPASAAASVIAPERFAGPLLAITVSRPSELTQSRPPQSAPARLAVTSPVVPLINPPLTTRKPELPPATAHPARSGTAAIPQRPGAVSEAASRLTPRRVWGWVRRAAIYGAIAFAAWFTAVMVSIAVFRFVDPPFSNLMLQQRLSGEVLVHKWLPIDRMPAQVIRAIVVSEDGRFCQHGGIDLKAIEVAIETSRDGTPRGASTITMQVAKNLYLWPSKSYVRKALEVPITLAIEAMWSKRRIFEVYANIAEWGPGVFGVEAAAGYHFGKSAGRVSEREAALLAVALPNPVTRDAGDPGPGTERLANTIQSRMRAQSRAAACIERPRQS